ncbi:MAG: hypothetical protein DIZ80_11545 [endosymbiont of Galathealinum brachiosum]|uniref:DUF4249 family protein n=1 Tax=endosymbiont of Galathealinum brachiosum TaxID=2200906 RepID=A0A370DDA9_9GAMM|nr:MAG: hypothetical protein DIZ80_11545 [endosymbiont of Galathealinum brachiosum]
MIRKQLFFKISFILLVTQIFTACDIDVDNNVPGVPPEGRFATVVANQHIDTPSVEVAIAISDNGSPVNLVGGDVVQASTTEDLILLLDNGIYNGSYAASLENDLNLDQIDFLMVHAPVEARQGRWFPADIFNIDHGPGELVGASATITLPPTPLNISISGTNFSSISDTFDITWTPESAGDTMRVRSAISCTDGDRTSTYGTSATLADTSDDGTENISIDQFIYDINDENLNVDFILDESRAALQELLIKLSNGEPVDEFFNYFPVINPINSPCEIQLFLFRERQGAFDSPTTNGNIFGSRSADITITYTPN